MSFIFNPMKMGLAGLYMPKFDVDHWFDVVERDAPDDGLPRSRDGRAHHREPALRRRRPLGPARGVDRQRAARAGDAEEAAGPDAAGVGDQLLRPHRGRARVHHDAEGRGRQAHRLGRQADAADGGARSSTPRPTTSCAPREVGELLVRLPGKQREYYKDDDATASHVDRRRLAAQRRPRVPRRRRLRLHLRAA